MPAGTFMTASCAESALSPSPAIVASSAPMAPLSVHQCRRVNSVVHEFSQLAMFCASSGTRQIDGLAGAVEVDALGGQHFGLAIQRQVPAIFGHQHRSAGLRSEERAAGQALLNALLYFFKRCNLTIYQKTQSRQLSENVPLAISLDTSQFTEKLIVEKARSRRRRKRRRFGVRYCRRSLPFG
jgi:hypothetical protein